jgi:hypothetical protein
MFEQYRSFSDYIKIYEIQRSEGLLLRHLTGVYKVLRQTVPDSAKNDALREMEAYLDQMLKQVDSSLLEEWERMRNPERAAKPETAEVKPPGAEEAAKDITRDVRNFTALVRARLLPFIRALSQEDFEDALAALDSPVSPEGTPWTPASLKASIEPFYGDHERIRLDPEARNAKHTHVVVSEDKATWKVQQVLIDPEEHNDWMVEFEVNLPASRAAGAPVVRLTRLGPITA